MAEPNMNNFKEWDGPLGALSPSPWLTSLDIPHDSDTIVQIDFVADHGDVEFVMEGGARQVKEKYGAIHFVGKKKPLGMNMTLKKTLSLLFGSTGKAVKGQWVALYVDKTIKGRGGEIKCGVRIRAKHVNPPAVPNTAGGPKPAAPSQPAPTRQPGDDKPE